MDYAGSVEWAAGYGPESGDSGASEMVGALGGTRRSCKERAECFSTQLEGKDNM